MASSHIKDAGQIYQLKQEVKTLSERLSDINNQLRTSQAENEKLRLEARISENAVRAPIPVSRPYVVFRRAPTMDDILQVVAAFYETRIIDIKSQRRTADIVRPRQVFMFLCYELTLRSYPEIGIFVGGRDHTTALHGKRKIENLIVSGDGRLKDEIDLLKIKIGELMAARNAGAVENGQA